MDGKGLITEELLQKVEEMAREPRREPAEVDEEPLGRYFASQRLNRLSEKLNRVAVSKDIREDYVPDLVHEVRFAS